MKYKLLKEDGTEVTADKGEPFFVIRGQDVLAVKMVKYYRKQYLKLVAKSKTTDLFCASLDCFLTKVAAWPTKKLADLP